MRTGLDTLSHVDKFCAAASSSELIGPSAAETAQKCTACLLILRTLLQNTLI